VSTAVILAASVVEGLYTRSPESIPVLFLLAASPFSLIYTLSWVARNRPLLSRVSFLAAELTGAVSLLVFGTFILEGVELALTGRSSWRGLGPWRGSEFFLLPLLEHMIVLPAFLLYYLGAGLFSKAPTQEGAQTPGLPP
jgi:hypothetical protein